MSKIATIGFFDGVHTGHRYLLKQLLLQSQDLALDPVIITFRQHPREILRPDYVPLLLTTPDERLDLLLKQQIGDVHMLDFSAIHQWSKEQFLHYLHTQFSVDVLLLGYDHRFGADGDSDYAGYETAANNANIRLVRSIRHTEDGHHVSSTEIRRLLQQGDISTANRLLGYPYQIQGRVINGRHIGRTIGFPTANIALPDARKLIPANGVYAVQVEVENHSYKGILNIGNNPTVGGIEQTLEVHLLQFCGNLYGKLIHLHLLRYLRAEQKFGSLEELKKQIGYDIAAAFPTA
ncbi:MAG: riboflavin biosynthesis protein RibF [Paludibacter sp.]|nr:riboflavin biosynthesis protein RibF [Bacteroidales bacterium]MCM1069864.1 riboflavin biosynthesis protein RibF [Prevotella sp.]MCM1353063.1 riboflavin biosynthesis protein RibF [Bacteroides sp.]MCM1443420.1 riboflavin biosynthesis protein RibF [Muribaculum sp.]MCM1481228.1 riboflavin biosynthesis protein RibF [Paludibacter sp.]